MMENQPYLLAELEDLSSIFSPLKSTSRIKYTCFNTSNNFLIFGATSGGLYVFRREPCSFLQLLPNKEGTVSQVSISPNEKLIAFSTIKGIICILEKTSYGAKNLVTTSEHQNEEITCLQWNSNSDELFVGDGTGKVSIVMASLFPTKGMFQTPSFVLMQLDSKIVQMDFSLNMLLVSTLTKCYICDTKKEIFRQIGHKLRDGEFGACILNTQVRDDVLLEEEKPSDPTDLTHLKLLCARPGSRIWECAVDGTVISTQHFKKALAVPPRKICFLKDSSSQNSNISNNALTNCSSSNNEQNNSLYSEQSFNFQKLYLVSSRFFFTFKTDGIYVFDPQKGVVVLWNNQIANIVDVKSANDVIYVWSGFGKMYALNLVSLEKYLIRLYFQKKYTDLARLCCEYKTFLMSEPNAHSKLYVLQDLDEKLNTDLADDLKPLINMYKEIARARKIQKAHRLKSDIYAVGKNVQFLLEDKRLLNQNKFLRPTCLNLKERSHSVSPERFHHQNGASSGRTHGSSASLPDLLSEENGVEEERNGVSESCFSEGGESPISGVIDSKVQNVLDILNTWKSTQETELSKSLIFNLFDGILELERIENHETIRPLAFRKYFGQPEVNDIADFFHSALSTKTTIEWIRRWNVHPEIRAVLSSAYPNVLTSNYEPETLELDYKLGNLLKLFVGILRETEVIELLQKASLPCYYKSLLEVLNYYEESSLSSVSDLTLNLENAASLPKLLNTVYFLIKVGQIDKCSEHAGKINLNDFFYLLLRFKENSLKSGKPATMVRLQCHTIFLTYIDKASKKHNLVENCNEAVYNYVVDCLEDINSTASSVSGSNCECGFTRSLLPPTIALFPEIGQDLIRKTWPKFPEKCFETCSRIPFLWRYLVYLRKNEAIESVLPLILHSGEILELENRSREIDENILESATKSLIKLKKGICLNCGRQMERNGETISWTNFGMLSIKLIGPEKTLDLFTRFSEDISSKELSQSFFQGLIFTAIMDKRDKGLRKNLVDVLFGSREDESTRTPVMSESVRRRVFQEGDKQNVRTSPETNSHHWGVKVNLKENCPVCGLPLDTKALVVEAGLIAFKCTHTFHSACLKKVNLKCPICQKEEESTAKE